MRLVRSLFVLPLLGVIGCSSPGGGGTVTASAGTDQSVASGGTVTLDASASRDSQGAPLTYSWSQSQGPSVTLSSAVVAKPTFTAPTVTSNTSLVFKVQVSNGVNTSAASVTVTVTPGSQGGNPIAVLSAPQTAVAGSTVTLDGSTSHGGVAPLTYAWAQTAGPGVTLSSQTANKVTFTAPSVVSSTPCTFTLAVIDNAGNVGNASATVNITPGATHNPPVASAATSPSSAQGGNNITLQGSATTSDGATITGWAWTQTGGSPTVTLSSTSAQNPTFTSPTVTTQATLTFSLVATDSMSAASSAATTTFTAVPQGVHVPPTATPSANPTTITSGGQVTLQGSGTANDGATITGYLWAQTAGPSVTLSSTSAQNPTFTAPTVASQTTLTFTLKVTDSMAAQSSAASVNVTVNAAHLPPTASASANPTTVNSGGSVTLQGSGTASGGATITGYAWTQTAGPTVTLSPGSTAQNPTFSAPTVASATTLTFSLVVTDSMSASSSPSTTNVTVNPTVVGNNIKYVFVVVEENTGATQMYNATNCPYINNTLMKPLPGGAGAAWGTGYTDPGALSGLHVSEPHYVWMEGGTNNYADHPFSTDGDPSASNSTSTSQHLVTQLNAAGINWMSYQEGLPSPCPTKSSSGSPNYFACKHDPFVFYQDVTSNSSYCAAHHKDFSSLATDLQNPATMAKFNFITPDLCNDMHGASGCPNGCSSSGTTCYQQGDAWLQTNLPPIINFVNANNGVIFLIWDEPESNPTQAFLVIGPNVINASNATALTHSSLLRSIEEIFKVSVINTGQADSPSSANDFSSFFQTGKFP